jgi:saccharopine dehydrogenase-like NADP-dependent oxidoreductase
VTVAKAAIEAKVNLVDLNDDFETTLEMFELDDAAKQADIAIIMGLGASPGVNNILVRAAARDLDEIDEIHTAWVMSAADPGGVALAKHLLHSLSGKALTVVDGQMVEVRSFVDGKERVDFLKPVGSMDIFHIGHPEPITLFRAFPGARTVDDKASFNPPQINQAIVDLGKMVRNSSGTMETPSGPIDAMEYAAAQLLDECKRANGVPQDGALRVDVKGKSNGKDLRIIYNGCGRITYGTGIPASIGAKMLCEGEITKRGVLAPEDCIDAEDFFEELLSRGIGDLEEERIS